MTAYLIPVTADGGFSQTPVAGSPAIEFATEEYVGTAIANLVDTAPTALDTLNELAAALGDDANYAATITTALGNKADSSSLATVATSGSYTDLSNKPTIPTNTNQLTNGSGFLTSVGTISYNDLSNKPTIPTNTNQLTNGAGFITSNGIPSQSGNSGKYLTTNGSSVSWATVAGGSGTDYSTATEIAIGSGTGTSQGQYGVAIGYNAGSSVQSVAAIAIGAAAGQYTQGFNAIAIGDMAATYYQGDYAIAIGYSAGNSNQSDNSIVLNASGADVNASTSGFFVAPVRSDATPTNIIYYNTTTKEMTYGAAPSGGDSGGGGGGATASDYFSAQVTDMSGGFATSATFTLPVGAGAVLAYVSISGGPNIQSIGPSSWYTLAWTPSEPGLPQSAQYRFAPTPSGTQTVYFDSPATSGTFRAVQFVMESESTTQQTFLGVGQGMGWQTEAYLTNPIASGQVSWMTAGYCYGSMYAPDANSWASLQSFVASPGVTIYVSTDSANTTVYFRCAGSVWNASSPFVIGTYPSGGWSNFYINAYFFGV